MFGSSGYRAVQTYVSNRMLVIADMRPHAHCMRHARLLHAIKPATRSLRSIYNTRHSSDCVIGNDSSYACQGLDVTTRCGSDRILTIHCSFPVLGTSCGTVPFLVLHGCALACSGSHWHGTTVFARVSCCASRCMTVRAAATGTFLRHHTLRHHTQGTDRWTDGQTGTFLRHHTLPGVARRRTGMVFVNIGCS